MKFEDLSDYDLKLITSMAVDLYVSSNVSSRYEAMAEMVLSCIHSKGYDIQPYPKNLAKILAIEVTPGSRVLEPTPNVLIQQILEKIKEEDYALVRSSRASTWNGPNPSWYAVPEPTKKPWMM